MIKSAGILFLFTLCCIKPSHAQQRTDWRIGEINEIISLVGDSRHHEAIGRIETLLPLMNDMDDMALAIIYRMQGLSYLYLHDSDNAENAFLKAWQHTEHLGDTIPLKRVIPCDIGVLYCDLRNFAAAERFLLMAKRLHETNLDLGFGYARILNQLGVIAFESRRFLKAKLFLDTSVDILENLGAEYDGMKAVLLGSLSATYCLMGYMEDAYLAASKAKTLAECLGDEDIICTIDSYMGTIHAAQKDWKEASSCFEKACKSANVADEDYTLRHFGLAMTLFFGQDPGYKSVSRAVSGELRQNVISKFIFLTDAERQMYWAYYLPYMNALNAMLTAVASKEDNVAVLENVLFSKGLLLRTSTWINERIRSSANDDDREKMTEREMLLTKLKAGGQRPDSTDYYHNRLLMIEKELLRSNVSFSNLSDNLIANWKDISKSLDRDEAAIEFAPISVIPEDGLFSGEEKYLAIVITSSCKYPAIVPVCSQGEIERLVVNRTRLSNSKFINNMYSSDSPRSRGEELYELVWRPLEAYVSRAKTIYYSPIGVLSSISFCAISHGGEFLCERYNMRMVSSIAEVIRLKTGREGTLTSAAVYGGIVYDVDSSTLLANANGYEHDRGGSIGEDEQERSGWSYLAGTVDEALGVQQRLESTGMRTRLYMGDSANEESFKVMDGQSPSVIHIATHGFFLSDPKQIVMNPFLCRLDNGAARQTTNYLNRSGLLFAGGNRAWTGEEVIEGIDDGILTAEEISRLNLSGTDVVVLSACETGLGVSVSAEGVFGLQRAFKLAGVNTLIMSLWCVSDVTTSELMLSFYDLWMGGMEKHEAFYAAQDAIREKYRDPYKWAGFVMMD